MYMLFIPLADPWVCLMLKNLQILKNMDFSSGTGSRRLPVTFVGICAIFTWNSGPSYPWAPSSPTLVVLDTIHSVLTSTFLSQALLFAWILVIFYWKSLPLCPTGSQIPCKMELITPSLNLFFYGSLTKSPKQCVRVLSLPQYPQLMRLLLPYIFLPKYIIKKNKNQSPSFCCAWWTDHLSLTHLQ